MPKRAVAHRPPATVWNSGTIVNVALIPVLTAIVYFTGNYFTTGYRLTQVETAVQNHEKDLKAEAEAREKARNEFLESNRQIVAKIGDLDKTLAVTEQATKELSANMSKVSDSLQAILGASTLHPSPLNGRH